ncbi:FA complementation group M [Nomia melanderi]|uniref:FA complementation group M n=1 Tax=Nomia melanderi TaxID=2448451 RepID=UPI003FCC5BBE
MELSQNLQISSDPSTKGFDLSAGKTWIYPENYPVRDYQFNIVQAAIYNNTLVCLPTGLGKTFIAAVVMYNFWRWYPCGKVVFLAPTKPLVAQQIFACHNIMGIPSTETIELTGATNQKQREIAWFKQRVIFATPQVFHNDLEKNIIPSDLIKCVVIDEAHKALGKHSYCECIRILSEKHKNFRVLALSATPGNKIDNVHEVLQNLCIAHMELRDETSPDIIPYINHRKLDIILVPLNRELTDYKEKYILIMDRHVKILIQYNVLRGHTANISKGRIFHLLKEFQKKTNKSGSYGIIIKTLNILMTMYHAYELMIRDGLRAFLKFYQNHSDKFWMNEEIQLQDLLQNIEIYLGPFPDAKSLCPESISNIPQNLIFGHTKFEKLKELLEHHFNKNQNEENDTRAIVFVEYRDIVSEIYVLLLQCQPLIRPQMFVGQAGQKQKQQIQALKDFRNNRVNVLISTSIGEEGLDVGEVDLIICFDISQHSPTRLVQRMGRTGRRRDGHIIILVTDGREHETLKSTMARRDSLNNKILNTSNVFSSLYQDNPRMIPDQLTPECLRMYITVQPKSPPAKRKNEKKKPEKKSTKRKNTSKKSTVIESNPVSQSSGSQSLMAFFQNKKHEDVVDDNIFKTPNTQCIQSNNVCKTIKPSDVKILSSDSDAVDFLTVCALRNSKKDPSVREENDLNNFCQPTFSTIKDFFNFSIPDLNVLNCLITLNDIPRKEHQAKMDLETEYMDNKIDYNDDEQEFASIILEMDHDECVVGKSNFEDLLDDSSKSNESDGLIVEEEGKEHINNNINSISTFKKQTINTVASPTLELGTFEDILNEMSEDSEHNILVEETEPTKCIDIRNDAIKKTELLRKNSEVENNMELPDSSFAIVSPSKRITDKDNVTPHTHVDTKNKSSLTITQAIKEIALINSSSSHAQNTVVESEDDMFQDESIVAVTDNVEDFQWTIHCSNEENITIVKDPHNENTLDNEKKTINTEFKVDEYEWGDDFEVYTNSAPSSIVSNKPENKPKKTWSNDAWDSDDESWFSAEKSFKTSRNVSGVSIAKKLANVKESLSSQKENLNFQRNRSLNFSRLSKSKVSTEKNRVNENNRSISCNTSYFFGDLKVDDQVIDSTKSKRFEVLSARSSKRVRRRKRVRNEFIDDEAQVSSNDENETTEGSSGTDQDLEDFVSYTQNVHDTTDMQAHYLQTVRSPLKGCNGFLFKRPRTPDANIEIYSQAVSQADESYLNDSFCVGEEEPSIRIEELSELEKAEQELERRKRKRIPVDELDRVKKRKKRVKMRNIINHSSSSEDETERLREQIMEESILLAHCKRAS